MHYRNGREAKNGDVILQIGFDGKLNAPGVLYNATPGAGACMVDCLHVEDVMAMLTEKGLDKRPEGK